MFMLEGRIFKCGDQKSKNMECKEETEEDFNEFMLLATLLVYTRMPEEQEEENRKRGK